MSAEATRDPISGNDSSPPDESLGALCSGVQGLFAAQSTIFEMCRTPPMNPRYFCVSRDEKFAFQLPEKKENDKGGHIWIWRVNVAGQGDRVWTCYATFYGLPISVLSSLFGALNRLVNVEKKTEYQFLFKGAGRAWWLRHQADELDRKKWEEAFDLLGIPRSYL